MYYGEARVKYRSPSDACQLQWLRSWFVPFLTRARILHRCGAQPCPTSYPSVGFRVQGSGHPPFDVESDPVPRKINGSHVLLPRVIIPLCSTPRAESDGVVGHSTPGFCNLPYVFSCTRITNCAEPQRHHTRVHRYRHLMQVSVEVRI